MSNNKIVDIEALKATRQAFQSALEGGQIIPQKALITKQIEAVSSESGTIQETPFISQGTGTANGTSVVDTSPVGKHLEKQGNTVVINQLVNTNTETLTLTSGHKYLAVLSGVRSVISGTGQTISVTGGTDAVTDLTKWFGSNDNIPADLLSHPENAARYGITSDIAYNTGEIKNSDGRYLECGQGRQIWNEAWEQGSLNLTTGAVSSATNRIRSKNFIPVIPNQTYYYYSPYGDYVLFYGKNENYLGSYVNPALNRTFIVPSNCYYVKFYTSSSYGGTYNHDITISLYYTTGDSYDEHFPYVAPKTYDTGTEVLRSAGSVRDRKEPSGLITKRVGNRAYQSGDENDSTLLTDGTTTNYPLETPTTEQGTPFSENVEINDYSYMSWKDTDNDLVPIPQGCKIFYPADYVLLIDSLNAYINGDVGELAKKSETKRYKHSIYLHLFYQSSIDVRLYLSYVSNSNTQATDSFIDANFDIMQVDTKNSIDESDFTTKPIQLLECAFATGGGTCKVLEWTGSAVVEKELTGNGATDTVTELQGE